MVPVLTPNQPLQALMTDETIGNVPILILGNKIDRQEAISEEKLRELFGLYGQTTGKVSGREARAVTNFLLDNSSSEARQSTMKEIHIRIRQDC